MIVYNIKKNFVYFILLFIIVLTLTTHSVHAQVQTLGDCKTDAGE